jgi:hypothetical protein
MLILYRFLHAVQGNVGEEWRDYPSPNVAKKMQEFTLMLPREQLRPSYGDGFGGAPLKGAPSRNCPPGRA